MWFKRLAKLEKFQEWTWKFLAALPTLGLILFQHNAQLRHGIDTFPFTQDQFWYGWELWISTLGLILLLHRSCQRPNATKFRRPQIKHKVHPVPACQNDFSVPTACMFFFHRKKHLSVGFVPINYLVSDPVSQFKLSTNWIKINAPHKRKRLRTWTTSATVAATLHSANPLCCSSKANEDIQYLLTQIAQIYTKFEIDQKIQKGTINRTYASNGPVVLALKQSLAYTGMFFLLTIFKKKNELLTFSVNSNRRKFNGLINVRLCCLRFNFQDPSLNRRKTARTWCKCHIVIRKSSMKV